MLTPLAAAKYQLHEYLDENINNVRIGDFLHSPQGGGLNWLVYSDASGNSVSHGSDSGKAEVHILIKQKSREQLEQILCCYLHELVSRHRETLHDQGHKQFKHLSIRFQYGTAKDRDLDIRVCIGSSGFYNQDEIAYEVMATLSDLPVYKVVSPMFYYESFVRLDTVGDKGTVRYSLEEHGISVEFGYSKESSRLIVTKKDQPGGEEDRRKFIDLMLFSFDGYVKNKTGKTLVYSSGRTVYKNGARDTGIEVLIDNNSISFSISVSVPYKDSGSFPRVRLARILMEIISKAYKPVLTK